MSNNPSININDDDNNKEKCSNSLEKPDDDFSRTASQQLCQQRYFSEGQREDGPDPNEQWELDNITFNNNEEDIINFL